MRVQVPSSKATGWISYQCSWGRHWGLPAHPLTDSQYNSAVSLYLFYRLQKPTLQNLPFRSCHFQIIISLNHNKWKVWRKWKIDTNIAKNMISCSLPLCFLIDASSLLYVIEHIWMQKMQIILCHKTNKTLPNFSMWTMIKWDGLATYCVTYCRPFSNEHLLASTPLAHFAITSVKFTSIYLEMLLELLQTVIWTDSHRKCSQLFH